MVTAEQQWLRRLRSPICQMVHHTTALADTTLSHASLTALILALNTQHLRMLRIWQLLERAPQTCHATRCELKLFVKDYIRLLAAVTPQLDRLGSRLNSTVSSSIGTPEEDVFWELYVCVAISSDAFHAANKVWSELWAGEELPLHHAMYSAFYDLLIWLLKFSRSPAWMLMRQENHTTSRDAFLALILL